MKIRLFLTPRQVSLLFAWLVWEYSGSLHVAPAQRTLTNLIKLSGPDPWVLQRGDWAKPGRTG